MVNRLMEQFGSKYDFYGELESVDGKSGKMGFTLLNGQRVASGQDSYTIGGQQYNFKRLYSQSGSFYYGFWEEARAGLDLNNNGVTSDRFLVVVTDPWEAGRFDLVYVDTDGDRNLGNEVPLREYRLAQGTASFPGSSGNMGISFVISEIKTGAREVILGFDGNSHGTQVAGVVAANGTVKGVAPGAQLLVIKALDKNGKSDWDKVAEAIRYAAQAGARVINLSLADYRDLTSGYNTLTQLVDKVTEQYGVVFTVAAGNKGPGLASLATPGNARSAIGVGAYISPAMWQEDYGYQVPRETLWYFSSVGPRQDGMMGPTVIAPGGAVSTFPTWKGTGYSLVEGTSIASAHTAGVVALLLDSASRSGLKTSPASIKQAIIAGARPIDHFNPVEAGAGALDGAGAWSKLRHLPVSSPVVTYTYLIRQDQEHFREEYKGIKEWQQVMASRQDEMYRILKGWEEDRPVGLVPLCFPVLSILIQHFS
ncbi:hypothetical protein SY88_11670 [Clostridiales bacterium PH28_bin88]|nr:hypothetical protein SY88_11670 [Clostridiales bacterium PH28_bin88]